MGYRKYRCTRRHQQSSKIARMTYDIQILGYANYTSALSFRWFRSGKMCRFSGLYFTGFFVSFSVVLLQLNRSFVALDYTFINLIIRLQNSLSPSLSVTACVSVSQGMYVSPCFVLFRISIGSQCVRFPLYFSGIIYI